jgi:hypothetical protein
MTEKTFLDIEKPISTSDSVLKLDGEFTTFDRQDDHITLPAVDKPFNPFAKVIVGNPLAELRKLRKKRQNKRRLANASKKANRKYKNKK